jgi:hypothetical protein
VGPVGWEALGNVHLAAYLVGAQFDEVNEMRANLRGVLAGLCLVTSPAVFADTPFSSFGQNHEYFTGGGGSVMPGNDLGYQFESGASGSLGSIEAAILSGPFGAPTVNLTLWADLDGHLGGLLGSWEVIADGNAFNGDYITIQNADSEIDLTAGETYWLLARTDGVGAWNLSDSESGNYVWGSPENYTYTNGRNGAFAVYTTTTVPEPATLAIVGLGALGFARRRVLRRR